MTASAFRLLELHNRINQGKSLEKADLLETFCIDSKTFQRDINKLRDYYREKGLAAGGLVGVAGAGIIGSKVVSVNRQKKMKQQQYHTLVVAFYREGLAKFLED